MDKTGKQSMQKTEIRALTIGMWGNLFMGLSGVLAAILSNSQAILVDGLFSMIGFTAAIVAKRISRMANAMPDKYRPFGYAADEAIFTTFRSLSLLGLVLFALSGSVMSIYAYLKGNIPPALNMGPLLIYFVVIAFTCALLWFIHNRAWRRNGQRSDILRLEAKAAAFDGLITVSAGGGLVLISVYRDGFLAPIAPVGDSVIVLILCLVVVSRYFQDFLGGLGELAGVTAHPANVAVVRRALRDTIDEDGGTLRDLSVSKLGRTFWVTVYYSPSTALSGQQADDLALRLELKAARVLTGARVVLLISERGRQFPDTPAETGTITKS
jgi:divalent metal cation (Fe/Co/Zn/Cd) transporter